MKAPIPLERQTQQALVQWLRWALPPGSKVQAVRNERMPASQDPVKRMNFHAVRKKDGYEWGFPDLLCLMPEGRCFFVEVKREVGSTVSERQADMHAAIRSLGFGVVVARTTDELHDFLLGIGVTPRLRPEQKIGGTRPIGDPGAHADLEFAAPPPSRPKSKPKSRVHSHADGRQLAALARLRRQGVFV